MRFIKLRLILACLVLIALKFVSHASAQNISFEPESVSFGIVEDSDFPKMSALLHNRTGAEVSILEVKPSCGCVKDLVTSGSTISAYGSIKIEFETDIHNRRGFQNATIAVSIKDKKIIPTLSVKGWVVPEQRLVPLSDRVNLTFGEGAQRLKIQGEPKDLEKMKFEFDENVIRCFPDGPIRPTKIEGISEAEFLVSSVSKATNGSITKIRFRSGEAPEFEVPVLCPIFSEEDAGSSNIVTTEQLFIGRIANAQTVTKQVAVAAPEQIDFVNRSPGIAVKDLKFLKREGDRSIFLISFVIDQDRSGILKSTIDLKDSKTGEKVGSYSVVGFVQ